MKSSNFASLALRPLKIAHVLCTLFENYKASQLLWCLNIKSKWMVRFSSNMNRDQWFELDKGQPQYYKYERFLKFFFLHLATPPLLLESFFKQEESYKINSKYMLLLFTTFFANVCTSMKSNHVSFNYAWKFVRPWTSLKTISISTLFKPLKNTM
jgi:hypothetical protein